MPSHDGLESTRLSLHYNIITYQHTMPPTRFATRSIQRRSDVTDEGHRSWGLSLTNTRQTNRNSSSSTPCHLGLSSSPEAVSGARISFSHFNIPTERSCRTTNASLGKKFTRFLYLSTTTLDVSRSFQPFPPFPSVPTPPKKKHPPLAYYPRYPL